MNTIIIRHVPKTDPPEFQVSRDDFKGVDPVQVTSPFGFPVDGRPASDLMREMQWYLEEFLTYPFPPHTDRAKNILDSLEKWGKKAFNDLFNSRESLRIFDEATKDGYDNLCVQVMSDDPLILQWPWEAMLDPQASYFAVNSRIERRLNKVRDPIKLSAKLPKDRINILLVTARPYENDVHYRSISRSLVELIEKGKIPAHVHVLRPPTFDGLISHLKERPDFYHIIHFDGHGGYGGGDLSGPDHHRFAGSEGVLVFEKENGEPDEIKAEQLSGLMRDHAVPITVLNACQSAMLDPQARSPFASVAAALVQAGIRGVVAMSYSLYVSGAQEFLPAFYSELFKTGDLSAATRAGRQKMFGQMQRVCSRGRYELKDFLVPVIYRQEPYDLTFKGKSRDKAEPVKRDLPEEAKDTANPYGFIGRDREILKIERALRKDTPAVLIQGIGGVGKTTLAHGLLKWLNDTDGMDGCIWLKFSDIRSAEYVINSIGCSIFGPNFPTDTMERRVDNLARVLKQSRLVLVWDNFESAAGIKETHVSANLSEADRGILLSLLEKIRGGKTKVIITSRSEEDWLGIQRIKVSIGGLVGEEKWEYCDKILDNLGLKINRDDEDLVELMEMLGGHPLAMRVVLPRLEKMTARQVISAIQSNMAALGPEADKLYATLRFAVDNLAEELKPLLIPLALHELFISADILAQIAQRIDKVWEKKQIDTFFQTMASSGLLVRLAGDIHELHPALTGFLRSKFLKSISKKIQEPWRRAFVDVMGRYADQLSPRPLHEQRSHFYCLGANFHFALSEAERLEMNSHERALVQLLACFARNNRNFFESRELFERWAKLHERIENKEGEAMAYHQLGRVAEEQRHFKEAERWYLKSLAISDQQSDEKGKASTYHQLAMIAEKQGDLKTAQSRYFDSLDIKKKLRDEEGIANTFYQLGMIASKQGDFNTAKSYYLDALAIKNKLGDEEDKAGIYHQMGIIARRQKKFKIAKEWCSKSLEISERYGIDHIRAATYNLLGAISLQEKKKDYETAEKWLLKSLAIEEKRGHEHGVALACNQLGVLAGLQKSFEESGRWLIKCIIIFQNWNDPENVKKASDNFMASYKYAPSEIKAKLKVIWEEAGLGPLPDVPKS